MRFAEPIWLSGLAVALLVAGLLVAGGVILLKAVRRFGDRERVEELVTYPAGTRRAVKGVLLVLAVAAGFVALAQPQYGRGTRLIPATNLDVIVVLDYSKSMFARDVTPSRIDRAKSEVSRLIAALPGARFGAVAFAGEPISFPLTSDGASIAQFFRQLSPLDMPVGGTAIARALEAGRQLLVRDPISKRHKKVMLLVTDGEDLEGDPVSVAEGLSREGLTIHVVQIGGRTPEPIPDVSPSGEVVGLRRNEAGEPITTSLSAAGEEQLAQVAEKTGGTVVRSEKGDTGIQQITRAMSRMMTEELSERVETVYADVYAYPAGLAALLLLIEAFLSETRRSRKKKKVAEKALAGIATTAVLFGCEGGLSDPFLRHSPVVDDAIQALDAGKADAAVGLLTGYLSTGRCKGGEIATPESIRALPNASYDLGLALFRIGESFGARFGEPEAPTEPNAAELAARRSQEIDCALRIVRLVATDESQPVPLRARAHYLSGNLEFLRQEYEPAVEAYDAALKLVPGFDDEKVDGVGRDAAWNRAIALRRIEEEKEDPPDAGSDASPPPNDGGSDDDGGNEEKQGDGGSKEPPEADGGSSSSKPDGGPPDTPDDEEPPDQADGGAAKQQPEPKPEPSAPPTPTPDDAPPPTLSQDERVLDQLEQAPTVQQEAARRRAARPLRGMEDK